MIDLSKARRLCTAAELRFVESCRERALAKASEAQLREKLAGARELRDKWADAFTRQRRQTKKEQGFPANRADVRSREKSELFAEVLARVEARLEEVTSPAKPRRTKETAEAPKSAGKGPAVHAENIADQHTARQQWADAATKRDRVKYGQMGASTATARERSKIVGLDARIRAHVQARGQRSQARRDSKGKR